MAPVWFRNGVATAALAFHINRSLIHGGNTLRPPCSITLPVMRGKKRRKTQPELTEGLFLPRALAEDGYIGLSGAFHLRPGGDACVFQAETIDFPIFYAHNALGKKAGGLIEI